MADMLVRLYDLPDSRDIYSRLKERNIEIVRPMSFNRDKVLDWIKENFGQGWSTETSMAFGTHPISCFVAVDRAHGEILGFAGYDCTYKNFFGPTGVKKEARGGGIGTALLLRCLEAMRDEGYGYAVIGDVGPTEFYAKTVGAQVIENSAPGVYKFSI